ncbi:MAG TPA: hypothetical protein VEK08_12915 [Planctomycetota bacterium]|nr:hypothetical protein [Planctomycetota bacterium]
MRNFILCAAIMTFSMGVFSAEKPQKRWETERQEAQLEEQREQQLSFEEKARMRYQYRGILQIEEGLDDGNPDVVGSFVAEDAGGHRVYMLKIEDPSLVSKLKALDRKKVALVGKIRNSGKYILVSAVVDQSGSPIRSRRRAQGGL